MTGNNVTAERAGDDTVRLRLETQGCELDLVLSELGARKLAGDLQRALREDVSPRREVSR